MKTAFDFRNELENLVKALADFPPLPPKRPRMPVRRRPPRVTWEDRLHRAHRDFTQMLPPGYDLPTPEDLPRLKAARGTLPYYEYWLDFDGHTSWKDEFTHVPRAWQAHIAPRGMLNLSNVIPSQSDVTMNLSKHVARDYGTSFFAWAVPDWPSLNAIAELDMPVYEIGSGRGYWAWHLERMGVRVLTYEPDSGYDWFWRTPDRTTWKRMPTDHALLFCWPAHSMSWPHRTLRAYQGSTVIYVGENGGCTGTPEFERLLDTEFEEVRAVRVPQWHYIHDYLRIYRRR
jgi:hypothetical protein